MTIDDEKKDEEGGKGGKKVEEDGGIGLLEGLTDDELKGIKKVEPVEGTGKEQEEVAEAKPKKARAKKAKAAAPVEEEKDIIEETAIYTVKTSIGHEKIVADVIAGRARRRAEPVYSILSPQTIRGYVFIEATGIDRLKKMIKGIPKVRGVVSSGTTPMTEIEPFLTPKPLVAGIVEGDIVELIAGPFKGEKARVRQIDETKEEITVELFEAMIAIPITVRGDHVRVIEKDH